MFFVWIECVRNEIICGINQANNQVERANVSIQVWHPYVVNKNLFLCATQ